MKQLRIAVYPGDGIGVDVTGEAVRCLESVQAKTNSFGLELTEFPWGAAYARQHGQVAPDDFLQVLADFDAIFLGAVGWPEELPDHVTLAPLIQLRQSFDLYACVRPSRLLPGIRSPLADRTPEEIDLVVIRENSEGEYLRAGGRIRVGQPEEIALQTAVHSRRGIERILRFGFEMAATRRGRLTMITKSNAQGYGYVLWDEIFAELKTEFPLIEADKQHVDAAVMNFVRCPDHFDVVVASNLFGDILTDLGGVIAGGLGLAPSANLNPERRFPSLFEPVHGSAPDIAGKGIANPTAAILSVSLMLDWLHLREEAELLQKAVEETLAAGHATPDLGGSLSTSALADEILMTLGRL